MLDKNSKLDMEIMENLRPENLIAAYAQGYFPMVEEGELWWFCPEERGLLPLDESFHVSRSLAKKIRQGKFVCTANRAFDDVIKLCAQRAEGTWISPEVYTAYSILHKIGLAHSVEAWHADAVGQGKPVGGLYGVSIGGAFFAESMFHTATDAGKVALCWFVDRLREREFEFCDIQWTTDNLERFGAYEMPKERYLKMLEKAVSLERHFDKPVA